jgi:hypothetical protein
MLLSPLFAARCPDGELLLLLSGQAQSVGRNYHEGLVFLKGLDYKYHIFLLTRKRVVGGKRAANFVALDYAMEALAKLDPRKVQVVEIRFFGGLSVKETAEVLGVSSDTVMRDWSTAKAWLYRELDETSHGL